MKKNLLTLIVLILCSFSAKTSHAQLSPGDIAIIGVNGETRSPATFPFKGTIAFVSLVDIPSGTTIYITDEVYNGTGFIVRSADAQMTWILSQNVPKGTVFSVVCTNDTNNPVISPSQYGGVTKVGWGNNIIRPIDGNGDAWLIYTKNPDNSLNFIYGFINTNYIPTDKYDTSTGWNLLDPLIKSQSSVLPTQLLGTNAYNSMVTYPGGPTLSNDFNYYNDTFTGTKTELLNKIKNPALWVKEEPPAVGKDLSPGTSGGAFQGTQPIYTVTAGPTVTSVTSSTANGTYKIGDVISVQVTFSEAVTVTGTPVLTLNTDAAVNYSSGSGTTILTFNYTVASGQSTADLDYAATTALSLNGGTIKAAGSTDAILTLAAPGAANSLGNNNAIVIDGIAPTGTSVNSSTPNGSYKAGDLINISLNFSEAVTVTGTPQLELNSGVTVNYTSGSGTSTLSFNYTVQAGDDSADLDYTSTSALTLNGGTLNDAAGNNATLTLPASGAAGSLGANKNIVIDNTAPVVSSVNSSQANGTYKINDLIPVTVNFSEAVTVTGTPTVSLNSGGTASYASGSGTSALVFNYTVGLSQSIADLDQASSTALVLAGGTIKDAAGNNATLTLAAPGDAGSLGANKNIVINTLTPTIVSITRIGNASTYTSAAQFFVTFSENVTGVNTSDFSITSSGGVTAPAVTFVSGSNATRTVTVSTGTGSGTLRLDLKSSGTGIINAIGNEILGGYTAGEVFTIDKAIPTLTAVTIASNNANTAKAKTGDVITVSFTASETIGTPIVSILGNPATAITNTSGNDWTATYTAQAADANGVVPFNIAFTDVAGNAGTAVTATTNASSVTFDKTLPTLTTVAIVSNNASNQTAKTGDVITLSFTASEAVALPVVTVAGNAAVTASAGGNSFTATYILTGAEAAGVIPFNIAFTDLAGNVGTPVTATTNSSSVTYDKVVPTLSTVAIASNNLSTSKAKAGDVITLNFTSTETIATPTVTLGGAAATATNTGANDWTASLTVNGVTPQGILAFNIAFTDLAGNVGIPVTATTNSSIVTVDRTAPAAPTGLAAISGNTQNVITWNASTAPDFDKYVLYGGTTINPTTAIQTIPAGALTYTHTGLTNGTGYFYRIAAVDLTGNEGAKSGNIVSTPKGTQTITFATLAPSTYGAAPITLTATSTSGLPVTYTSSDPSVATISGSTVTVIGQGTTTITAVQNGNGAFLAATPVTQDLVVNKKEIAVNAAIQTKVYGEADPALTYTFSPALTGTDTFTGDLNRAPGENTGNYATTQGTLALNNNYTLAFTSAELSITARPVTVTAAAKTKIFTEADPVFTYTFSPALIGTDTFTGNLDRAAGEDIGTYAINQGDLSLGTNYQITYVPAALTITSKAITVTAAAKTKVYGEADPALTYTFSPALNGTDTFTGNLDRATGENTGNYAITQGTLALSNNYTIAFTSADLNITAKPVTVTATAANKEYGTTDPALAYTFSPALIGTDTFTGTLGRAAGENIGNYAVGQGTLALSSNYTLNYTSADFSITKKTVTVTATAKTKVYGVIADPSLTYTFSPVLIGTDVFSGSLSRIPGENVGSYAINQGTITAGPNYTIAYVPANLSITTKALTLTAVAKTKTYGEADPALTYTFSPVLIGTDTFTGTMDRATGENIGNYAINQGTVTAGSNYAITYVPANLSITTKTITVNATAKTKVYGAADPALTYTFTPALIGTDVFTGTLNRAVGENAGSYTINKNTLALNSNYLLNYTTASLIIGKAALIITAEDKEKFTGTANPMFSVKYTGFVNGETDAVLTTPATLSTTATTNSPIGSYSIVPSGAVAANYQISYVNGTLTVKPGAPTNVLFAATTLYENRASGTAAGTLSSTSDDPNATFAYSLVSGTGDTDNALFSISGNRLLTAATLDYENKTTYSVRLRSTTQYGFSLDKTFTIALSDVNELPTLAAIANQSICYTTTAQNINLTGISAGPETGQSTSISVAGNNSALLQNLTVSGSGATAIINYSIKTGASGTATVTVTVKDDGGTANGGLDTYIRTFVITVNALPIVAINSDKGTQISKGEIVTLSATGGVSYAWAANGSIQGGLNSASIKVRPLVTTTYIVTATNASGCTETQTFTITVLDDMAKVKANNIMSPNGDGINDNWVIENIDVYPNNEVKIFDRSGRLMYSKKGYDNSWDARLNGAPLAEGTYYYLIDFGPGKSKVKGFITIPKSN